MSSNTLDTRLENQKKRTEIATLKAKELGAKVEVRRNKVLHKQLARFDVLEEGHQTQRLQSRTERNTEDSQLTDNKKLKGVAFERDLQRNAGTYSGLLHQFRVCVVGVGPKVKFNTTSADWNKLAADWLNSDWAKWCDGNDDTPLADQVACVLEAVKREGDILCVFDDFDRDDGTLRWFESDQLPTIDQQSWENASKVSGFAWNETINDVSVPMLQANGIVRDHRGRVQAYVTTADHGKPSVMFDEVTIIPRWHIRNNPTGSARLIKQPWRLSQYRGQGKTLAIAAQVQDSYEMIAAVLQTAKNSSQRAGSIETDKDAPAAIVKRLAEGGMTPEQIDCLLFGDGDTPAMAAQTYEQLEGTFGGKVDYLNPGEKFVAHNDDRPSANIREFAGMLQEQNGASMGVARSRSTLRAETSFTAFRGEELMSWQTFEVDQKFLERRLMDFLTYKAITWAGAKKEVTTPPKDFQKSAQWIWPRMKEVNQVATANAEAIRIKSGTVNYAEILGPNWREIFAELGIQFQAARDENLPLAALEMKSGGTVETQEPTKKGSDNE